MTRGVPYWSQILEALEDPPVWSLISALHGILPLSLLGLSKDKVLSFLLLRSYSKSKGPGEERLLCLVVTLPVREQPLEILS